MNERNLSFYFPDSNSVSGLKVFKEAGSSLTGFYFTKENISRVIQLEHSRNYAIYFLFNDSDDQTVYIGQSTTGIDRIKNHIKNKDFWSYCILIVSDNNSFDHSVINFLEYFFIEEFKKTYFSLNNVLSKPDPVTSQFLRVTYNNYAQQVKFLLEANGIKFIEQKLKPAKQIRFKAGKGKNAELFIHEGIFMLAIDSIIRRPIESSKDWADNGKFYDRYNRIFDKLIADHKAISIGNNEAQLVDNVPFKFPSAPATLCSGYSENGYDFWKGLDVFKSLKEDHFTSD